jgi:hypothetical protein
VTEPAAIVIPNDEFLARPHLVAWLAHPQNEKLRARTLSAAVDLARARTGHKTATRADRVEDALRTADKELSRQLIAGRYFELQLFDLENAKFGLPPVGERAGAFSQTSLGRRVETVKASNLAGNWLRMDRENAQKVLWRKRLPSLGLAIGATQGLAERPDITDLLFGDRMWAIRAVGVAQQMRRRALELNHPDAANLLNLELATFVHITGRAI